MDGRAVAKDPNPSWLGYSTGRWDGDALVVTTVGLNGKTWLDTSGHPTTDALTVTERFRRPTFGQMEIEITSTIRRRTPGRGPASTPRDCCRTPSYWNSCAWRTRSSRSTRAPQRVGKHALGTPPANDVCRIHRWLVRSACLGAAFSACGLKRAPGGPLGLAPNPRWALSIRHWALTPTTRERPGVPSPTTSGGRGARRLPDGSDPCRSRRRP